MLTDYYANHLNSYVQYMRNRGVTIDVTSVQNEPDWHPAYDSMDWSGTELANFVRDGQATVSVPARSISTLVFTL